MNLIQMSILQFGLGKLFQEGQRMSDIDQVFAVMFVVLIISLIVDFGLFGKIEVEDRHRWGLTGSR